MRVGQLHALDHWPTGMKLRSEVLVGPAGVEPATLGLEIRCSIRLSYGPSQSNFINELWVSRRMFGQSIGTGTVFATSISWITERFWSLRCYVNYAQVSPFTARF